MNIDKVLEGSNAIVSAAVLGRYLRLQSGNFGQRLASEREQTDERRADRKTLRGRESVGKRVARGMTGRRRCAAVDKAPPPSATDCVALYEL